MSQERTNEIVTRVAHAGFGEHEFRGARLFGELTGRIHTVELHVLALTGRRLSTDDAAVFEDLLVLSTMADPRIWPLKATRLIGAYGGFVPAFAAGYLSMDKATIGPTQADQVAKQLMDLMAAVEGAPDDVDRLTRVVKERLAAKARFLGFGVVFRDKDERVDALRRCVQARGVAHRPYWRLMENLADILSREKGIQVNILLGAVALFLDQGFGIKDIEVLTTLNLLYTFLANAAEAAQEPAAVLRCLPLEHVEYVGPAPRLSPRARGAP